jgi:CheY-like chemotaxis protein
VVTAMLQNMGLTVRATADGLEAQAELNRFGQIYDFVLLDLTMPRMGGVEVCNELLRRKPDTKIILMSGYAEADSLARLTFPKAVKFLQKPFSPDQLADALAELQDAAPPVSRELQSN